MSRSRSVRTVRAAFAALVLFSSSAFASNPYRIPDPLDADLRSAFDDLFNIRFDAAGKRIAAMQAQSGTHPMAALAQVVFEWWKLTVRVDETDPEASRPFLEAADRCLRLANLSLPQNRRAESRVAVGTTLGLLSRWSAANRAWFPAYSRGSRAAGILEDALRKTPAATDAYMTLGTFNYARGLLRKRLNAVDAPAEQAEALGIAQLRRAYVDATYFRPAAGLLLAGILTNKTPKDAVPLLNDLRRSLPDSPFVQSVLVTALYNVGDEEGLERESDAFLAKVTSGAYDPWFRPHALFGRALVLFRQRRWREAAQAFDAAAQAGDETNPYCTWARLYEGYALDAGGQRAAAQALYRTVLRMRPRFASREHAEGHLKRPFQDGDPELRKVEL